MFKPRSAAASATPPSVELVRQRAKHRLIGVSVLVLGAVVLFPLLFDTQPRPLPVDIPIEIPSRKTAKPLTVEPVPEVTAVHSAPSVVPSVEPKAPAKTETTRQPVLDDEVVLSHTPARPTPPVPSAGAVKSEATKADAARVEAAKQPVPDATADAARAQALLDGKTPAAAPKPAVAPAADGAGARYIVQVGAFADSAVAQAARLKLERAGLKTYTHETQTPEGKRIRVRLGPFATRAEAEKAAAKVKATGTAAAILTL